MHHELRRKLKYLALLDAVIEQEWEFRYYSFDSRWSASEEMASMRDGSGGEWFIHFDGDNVGFKCTSPADGIETDFERIKKSIPKRFSSFLDEPAFSMNCGSCIWYLENESWVKHGNKINYLPTPDTIFTMSASGYIDYVESYFEKNVDVDLVKQVFDGGFDLEIAQKLNANIDLDLLASDVEQIGEIT